MWETGCALPPIPPCTPLTMIMIQKRFFVPASQGRDDDVIRPLWDTGGALHPIPPCSPLTMIMIMFRRTLMQKRFYVPASQGRDDEMIMWDIQVKSTNCPLNCAY